MWSTFVWSLEIRYRPRGGEKVVNPIVTPYLTDVPNRYDYKYRRRRKGGRRETKAVCNTWAFERSTVFTTDWSYELVIVLFRRGFLYLHIKLPNGWQCPNILEEFSLCLLLEHRDGRSFFLRSITFRVLGPETSVWRTQTYRSDDDSTVDWGPNTGVYNLFHDYPGPYISTRARWYYLFCVWRH